MTDSWNPSVLNEEIPEVDSYNTAELSKPVGRDTWNSAELNEYINAKTKLEAIRNASITDGRAVFDTYAESKIQEISISLDEDNPVTDIFLLNDSEYPYNEDNSPYTYRVVTKIGISFLRKIIGASIVWNQLVDTDTESVTITSGNKYILWDGSTLTKATSDGTAISVVGGTDKIYDISAMFGSDTVATAITTAKFAELFPDYASYAYSENTIQSVSVSGHKIVGFNQWDEEIESGEINTNTGANAVNASRQRSKNYIEIKNNVQYYLKSNTTTYLFFYDKNKNYIGFHGTQMANKTFIPSELTNAKTGGDSFANAVYMRFRYDSTNSPIGKVCLNFSSAENGQYKPYKSETTALDHTTLRGLFKLDANNNLYADGDIYNSDGSGSVKYGIVDMGSLTWTYNSSYTLFGTNISDKAFGKINLICSKYIVTSEDPSLLTDKCITGRTSGNNIYIKDTAYTDATAFTSAVSGQYIVYELDTPTTATLTPFNPLSDIEDGGTEEFVDYPVSQDDRDVSIPAGVEEMFVSFGRKISVPDPPETLTEATIVIDKDGNVNITDTSGVEPETYETTTDPIYALSGSNNFTVSPGDVTGLKYTKVII